MMRLRRTFLASAVAVGLLLTGCAGSGEAAPTSAQAAGDLRLGGIVAPATFEARNMNWGNQSVYAQAVYDTLLRSNPNGVDVEPGLATEWSYNDDRTVLTLTLRDGVTFSDGTAFTADVAAQNLLRFRDGTSPQRIKAANVADAVAADETTLQITLSAPEPAFLVYLTQVAGLQESPSAFENADVATNPVGTGPYILDTDATVVGTAYVFEANPDYWDDTVFLYDSLTVNVYQDPTAMLNAIRGGQLDAANISDNGTIPQIEQAGFTVNPSYLGMTGLFLFDRGGSLTPALGDVRVRQAINHAIDAEAFLEGVGYGLGKPTQQVFRPVSEAWDESLDGTYDYDPDRARELLADAGYEEGFDLSLPSLASIPQSLTALVTQQLGDVGIRVTFTDVGANFIPDVLSAKYSAAYFTLQQDPVDSQLISFMLAPEATWNPFHSGDAKTEELIAKVRAGGEDAEDAARDLNAHIVDEAWFNPWYTTQNSFVTDADTQVEVHEGNTYPNLFDITPKS